MAEGEGNWDPASVCPKTDRGLCAQSLSVLEGELGWPLRRLLREVGAAAFRMPSASCSPMGSE